MFSWDKGYIGPAANLLASVPNLATPCNLDRVGMFNEIHSTPAADSYAHNWTKVGGPARFIGLDENTQGNWRGKYGNAGHEVIGVATSLPADMRVDWSGANTYTWAAKTDDPRATASTDSARVAACRYAGEIELVVELPAPGARLSLYCVDWDRTRAKQTVTLWSEDGAVLDRCETAKLKDGCYLTWDIRGCVRITIAHEGGPNAVVSGLFMDAAK